MRPSNTNAADPCAHVRFGSLATLFSNISLMDASGDKADAFRFDFGSLRLNVRFSPKRPFDDLENRQYEGPLSATKRSAPGKAGKG